MTDVTALEMYFDTSSSESSDPLAQCFMHRFAECVIEMGFPAQDKGKAVYGIVTVIHEHLDVVENTGIQVLSLIDGEK